MGNLFTLDADTKSIIQTALDDIITELGKTVRLVFPGKEIACTGCNGPTVGQPTGGVFGRHGGSLPIPATVCPLCNGKGKRLDEQTRELKMKCEWNPRAYQKSFPGLNVREPFSVLETKFYLTDLPDVLRADRLIAEVPMEPYLHQPFKLADSPGDASNIIQGRYCICHWERTN